MKTTLKHGIAVLFSMLWLLNASAQKTPPPQLIMPKAPADVAIDGSLAEWPDSTLALDAENNFKYRITYDATNLYIVANIDDHNTRRKILGSGLTISFNTEGKKRKTYSITYPTAPNKELSYVARSEAQMTTAKVSGFKGLDDNITLPDSHGFKGVYTFGGESMFYELAIPLKSLNLKPGNNSLNINFQFNALDPSASGPAEVDAGSSRGSRGNGRPASNRDQAPRVTSKPANVFVDTDFWLSYTLTN